MINLRKLAWSTPFRIAPTGMTCVVCENRIRRGDQTVAAITAKDSHYAHLVCIVNAGLKAGK